MPGGESGGPEPGCPFCEGREAETPPEVFALAPLDREPNAPGWRVRVVPNKYPALAGRSGRHEVVIHSPRHVTSFADLGGDEVTHVAGAWQERARVARAEGFGYVHALVNEGLAAGGSLPHTHSQLVWLAETPPAVAHEQRANVDLASLLASELADGSRIVSERDGIVALCPYAGRGPYELLIAPLEPEPDGFASRRLPVALALLAETLRRLRAVEGVVPLNAWLHTSAFGSALGHWHLEVLPRMTVAAGLELGAGVYVSPLPPEDAATRLRD